ncbi:flagellar hook-associated protein FlgL [Pontibacillus halophilus JSM 076056 = DSM 19796]|uniref:Flagellar hook-associated protein FlgL n=2 Tax=Pontibacillus TaxID=289201 RepID=A0A0A5GS13_9BACI|nr:flagellar hook-associated protein FlgL [Pontibacillus halophilus]KGX93950.1 flagellar hook-associated protein FlgL [Pontibacillus halophilus JSM 076056 = DSM 19796]
MRVTQNMLSNNMLRNISNSYETMGKYQEQLSTGKKLTKPSDDPVSAVKGMSYRAQLTEIEQYERNMNEVHTWTENTDAALDETTGALQRLRELAVQASNGTYEEGQLKNIGAEVSQLKDHLEDLANTEVNGKYLFNGSDTKNQPVDTGATPSKYPNNTDEVRIEVSKGIKVDVNVKGESIFSEKLFDDLDKFINNLNGTGTGNMEESIADLDGHINNTVNERADLGARMNRIEFIEQRLDTQKVAATDMLSENEDAELEEVITKLKTQESIHRAALSVGSRVIQPTLVDFLK